MNKNEINIAVWWVLDYDDGRTESLGGLERWTREIVFELVRKGFKVNIFQKSKREFCTDYYGAKITGIPSKKGFVGNFEFYNKFKKIADNKLKTIFISQDLAVGKDFNNSIAINHGVWWAAKHGFIKRRILEWFNEKYLRNVSKTICVDTNYINWIVENVTNNPALISRLLYVPNFFDCEEFKFKSRNINTSSFKILFPRRIMGDCIYYEPRGGSDAITALKLVRDSGFDCHLTILGQGNLAPQLMEYAEQLQVKEYVSFSTSSFDEMESQYHEHDIVLVPSRFSEGTSLSAIEALATGRYVIGSCIGGLQNIPLSYPLGDMVTPEPQAIANSITNYCSNVQQFGIDQETVNTQMDRFEKKYWINRVFEVIESL